MNQIRLGQSLGAVSTAGFVRYQCERLLHSLNHQHGLTFNFAKSAIPSDEEDSPTRNLAHQAGVNCLALDSNDGRYLASGGADATVRLWDLESCNSFTKAPHAYNPCATLARGEKTSHTHAITSISIYPFDPRPVTLLTTSHDKTLKLTSITPTSLIPIHTFSLDFAPYIHAISPVPDSSALVAVGTAHPAVRLLDLRSGLSTHSLPGHNGAVYTLSWSPKQSHILASGAHDGRVLFFDVRRANAAFASLDLDDALGVASHDPSMPTTRSQALDFNARAHNGPVTSVQWTPHPNSDKIVTTGHDQRIRVWDAATGRNDLVHFGPRIRNERIGPLVPLISPAGCATKPSSEVLLWPNDDGKGDIFMHSLREGNMLRILRTQGVDRAKLAQMKGNVARLTSGGRVNQMVWRHQASSGEGLEMYSAHGDGRICAWMPTADAADDDDDDEEDLLDKGHRRAGAGVGIGSFGTGAVTATETEERANKRKRKRDLLGELVDGLTKKPVTFS